MTARGRHYDIAVSSRRKAKPVRRRQSSLESPISRCLHHLTLSGTLGVVLAGCSLSPLHRKIKVGEEPFVVFVATGSDGKTDLFASTPVGGDPVRLTFTAMVEAMPRLTPQGDMVAFIRTRSSDSGLDLVVMNLLSGAERLLELPPEAGPVTALGWSSDRSAIFLRGATARWRVTAPPAPIAMALLDADEAAQADSVLMVRLGSPAFARAEVCSDGGICVTGPSGIPGKVSPSGTAPFRWGSDSLAWFDDDRIMIRSLGPGTARHLTWTGGVSEPRGGSYAEP
jgi:hypothetical protein